MTSSPRSALGPLGGHSAPGLVVMGALAELLPGASAVVTEARGPFGARHRWSLWIDGRWPYPKPRFLEGAAPWDPPFAGVVHGVWTLHPRATCRSLPAPSRAPGRIPCVRTGAEEFSGGNWMVPASPPVRRGCRRNRAPRAPLPFNYILPPRGSGTRLKTPGRLAMKLPG
ncbi:hypothetical protein N7534_005259 [Penicillium rubens]|nr:hypothetical protein N7505_009030 [Penicillium chrysogenum]KAJ5260691.1 hypothetical protein N7505_009041 [Penicillium chrysogenum]KAJ5260697.1 hypothetical protein N7505_009047 [Penicillium chrysogenum]KAJ5859982.1 hypothetical protein N7534_005259 [Penicillium rubens]KAJ6140622.1 hypothetical protein N7497_011515 [Penicillium chrysogenum]